MRFAFTWALPLVFVLPAYGQDALTVGSATAKRGEKASGWIDVPAASADGNSFRCRCRMRR